MQKLEASKETQKETASRTRAEKKDLAKIAKEDEVQSLHTKAI